MYTPVARKNVEKSPLAKLKAEFDRLRRKINELHDQLKFQKQQCEEAFLLYHSHFKPTRMKAGELITQYILRIIDLTKDPKILNKKQKEALNILLKKDLSLVFDLLPYSEIDPEIKKIYKTIYGKESDADFHEGLADFKDFLKEQTGEDDIDLSDLDPNDSPEEMIIKIMNSLKDKGHGGTDEIPPQVEKPKSKKELIKEQKSLELRLIQEKNLNNIYKRLVKELHPDLEQDKEKRAEKVDLMKQITVAYENNDLLSLISLESKWLNGVDDTFEATDESSLKAYNSLLKNQVQDLKNEIVMCAFDPRYFDIHPYIQECPEKPLFIVQNCISEVKAVIEQYSNRLSDISGKKSLQLLQSILDELMNFQNFTSLFSELDFLGEEEDDDDFFNIPIPRKRKKPSKK